MSFSKKVFLKKCFIDISTCKKQFFSPLVLFMAKNAIVKQAAFLISEGFPYYSRHSAIVGAIPAPEQSELVQF